MEEYRFDIALKMARENKGYSQKQLARMSLLSTSAIGKIERGITIPELDTIDLLCKALKISKLQFLISAGYLENNIN